MLVQAWFKTLCYLGQKMRWYLCPHYMKLAPSKQTYQKIEHPLAASHSLEKKGGGLLQVTANPVQPQDLKNRGNEFSAIQQHDL